MSNRIPISEKPINVVKAVRLMFLCLVIGLINSFFVFFTSIPEEAEQLVNAAKLPTGVATLTVYSTLILIIIIFLVNLFFIAKLSQGRNWARIVYLILFVAGISDIVTKNIPTFNSINDVIMIVILIVQVVALFLIFSKSSNDWYAMLKAERRVKKN